MARLLWKLLPSTYFCCQTTSVTAFKPWSAFAADSTIMAGKWPVKFFWGAWHFAYIIKIQRGGKCVKNEVYEKSSNWTLHFIEYRDCLICQTEKRGCGGGGETCQGKKKNLHILIFSRAVVNLFFYLQNLDGKWQSRKCVKLYYLTSFWWFRCAKNLIDWNICFTWEWGWRVINVCGLSFESNLTWKWWQKPQFFISSLKEETLVSGKEVRIMSLKGSGEYLCLTHKQSNTWLRDKISESVPGARIFINTKCLSSLIP